MVNSNVSSDEVLAALLDYMLDDSGGDFSVEEAWEKLVPVMQDLIGGQVPLFFSGMPPAMPHIRSGKLRALAVTTTRRSAATPDVPTMDEAGVPGFDISNWFAYFAPAGTPADVIAKLSAEINRSLKLQDVSEKLATLGAEPVGTSPEELARFLRVESAKFANLIKVSGAKGTD